MMVGYHHLPANRSAGSSLFVRNGRFGSQSSRAKRQNWSQESKTVYKEFCDCTHHLINYVTQSQDCSAGCWPLTQNHAFCLRRVRHFSASSTNPRPRDSRILRALSESWTLCSGCPQEDSIVGRREDLSHLHHQAPAVITIQASQRLFHGGCAREIYTLVADTPHRNQQP